MRLITVVAVAGLASQAAAQTASLSIVGAPATIDTAVTTTFTIDIVANADFGTHIVGGAVGIAASGDTDGVLDVQGSTPAWGAGFANDLGADGMGGHNGLVFGQVVFPPVLLPAAESELPGAIVASFQYSLDANWGSFLRLDLADIGQAFVLEVFDSGTGQSTQLGADSIDFGFVTIQVPAPGAMVPMAFCGLLVGRRRR